MAEVSELAAAMTDLLGAKAEIEETKTAGVIVTVKPADIADVMGKLRNSPEDPFDYLRCLTAVDYPDGMAVVYQLLATKSKTNLTVKTAPMKKNPKVASVTGFWTAANWPERETAELFGIVFEDHPDPRRLLTKDGDEAYPLRKDFKLDYGD